MARQTKKESEQEVKEKIPFLVWFEKNKKSFKNSYHDIIEAYIKEFNLPHFVYYGFENYFMPGRCLYPLQEHLKKNTVKRKE